MDLGKKAIFFITVMVISRISMGTLHKVGDSAGWTSNGNIDYNQWASPRVFRVGDTIVFEYNAQSHNVMQVSRSEFRTCNITSSIVTYSTGNDSITIKGPGHYYYVCGFPGHCQAGQKIDIRVPKNTQTVSIIPGEATIQFSPEDSPKGMTVPSASLNSALSLIASSWFLWSKLGLSLFVLGLYVLRIWF